MGKLYMACIFFGLMVYTAVSQLISVANTNLVTDPFDYWFSTVFAILGSAFALYWFIAAVIQAGSLLVKGLTVTSEKAE